MRNGRRLILVVNGLSSMNERSSEGGRLLDWGFRETETYALFKKGDVVDKADVWLGAAPTCRWSSTAILRSPCRAPTGTR